LETVALALPSMVPFKSAAICCAENSILQI
jgi:hypothetical protein